MEKEFIKVTKTTRVAHEAGDAIEYNAPHHFEVWKAEEDEIIQHVDFQKGPISEAGINGVTNEDLLTMVKIRLEHFQQSPYACAENDAALHSIENALSILRSRTRQREERGVEGTSAI